jgi:hypothetical protein
MTSRRKILDTSAFEPISPDAVDALLDRAKRRSAQLRRRPLVLLFGSAVGLRRQVIAPGGGDDVTTPPPPRRFSPTTMALGSVGVVVAVVIALVLVDVTGGGSGGRIPVGGQPGATTPGQPANSGGSLAPVDVPAPASVVDAVTGVSAQEANEVGVPPTSTVAPPTVKTGQPPLTIAGQPGAVFIGGEFCPYCAAERWAVVMAFSRFGSFSNLQETTSSPWDTYPSTPTFSFYGASYTSPFIALDAVEHAGNDATALGTRQELEPLTTQESDLWQTYDSSSGYPFLDIGNVAIVDSPSYVPSVLAGLDQQDVAARLADPTDPVTEDIVGTANYLTAAICSVLGPQAPSSWCTQPAIIQAAQAMGLS